MAEATIYRFQDAKAQPRLALSRQRIAAEQSKATDSLDKALELLGDLAKNPGFEFAEQEVTPHFVWGIAVWAIAHLARLDPADPVNAQLFASISTLMKAANGYLQARAGAVSPTGHTPDGAEPLDRVTTATEP